MDPPATLPLLELNSHPKSSMNGQKSFTVSIAHCTVRGSHYSRTMPPLCSISCRLRQRSRSLVIRLIFYWYRELRIDSIRFLCWYQLLLYHWSAVKIYMSHFFLTILLLTPFTLHSHLQACTSSAVCAALYVPWQKETCVGLCGAVSTILWIFKPVPAVYHTSVGFSLERV